MELINIYLSIYLSTPFIQPFIHCESNLRSHGMPWLHWNAHRFLSFQVLHNTNPRIHCKTHRDGWSSSHEQNISTRETCNDVNLTTTMNVGILEVLLTLCSSPILSGEKEEKPTVRLVTQTFLSLNVHQHVFFCSQPG